MPCIAGCAAIVRERQQEDFVLFVSTILLLLLLDAYISIRGIYISNCAPLLLLPSSINTQTSDARLVVTLFVLLLSF
jgi:hypothetical protein